MGGVGKHGNVKATHRVPAGRTLEDSVRAIPENHGRELAGGGPDKVAFPPKNVGHQGLHLGVEGADLGRSAHREAMVARSVDIDGIAGPSLWG